MFKIRYCIAPGHKGNRRCGCVKKIQKDNLEITTKQFCQDCDVINCFIKQSIDYYSDDFDTSSICPICFKFYKETKRVMK